jgi:hypothetical protein
MSDFWARIGANLVLVGISILGGILVFANLDVKTSSTQGLIIIGFLFYIMTERFLTIVDIIIEERSLYRFASEEWLLGHAILNSHIQVYTDNHKAYAECIDIAKRENVAGLENTVFRFGGGRFRFGGGRFEDSYSKNYDEWMKAKESLLANGKPVREIFDCDVQDYPLSKFAQSTPHAKLLFSGVNIYLTHFGKI